MHLVIPFRPARLPQRIVFLSALVLAAIGARDAAALSIAPNPVAMPNLETAEIVANIRLVGTITGAPAGGVTLRGAVAPTDQTLLFTVEHLFANSDGPLAAIGVSRASGVWSALGWVPGSGVDWSLYSSLYGGDAAIAGPLDYGQTSDVFFVSAASLPVGTTLDFSFQGYHGVPLAFASATVVPESGTLALVTGGLALLARARRR